MNYYVAGIPYSDELYHFGIKGQKWGIRRYQNEDGTLTPAGKARYGGDVTKMPSKYLKKQYSAYGKQKKLEKSAASFAKTVKDVYNTRERKELESYAATMENVRNQIAKKYGVSIDRVAFDQSTMDNYNEYVSKWVNKANDIFEQNKDKLAKSILEDMNWDITREGMDYVKKYLIQDKLVEQRVRYY